MGAVDLLVWASAVYGVAMIVTTFKLFAALRDRFPCDAGPHVTWGSAFGTLLRCTPCFATWVAWGYAALGYTPLSATIMHLPTWLPELASRGIVVFASGMAGAALAWTWRVILAHLGSQTL
jgi:hypothetical protein